MERSRDGLRQDGLKMRQTLGLANDLHGDLSPGYRGMADELVFGGIWSRPNLGLGERMISVLCVLSARERHTHLDAYVGSALHIGLAPRAVQEVLIHAGLYAGFVTSESALAIANEVFAQHGVSPEETDILNGDFEAAGEELKVALHGARSAKGYADPDHPTTGDLYWLATTYGYGALWNRPGLSRRDRFVCAVATFTTIDHHGQLQKFIESGLAELERQEVIEIIMQTAPYSGFPRALNALAVAAEVLPAA
ncbi:MAG: carboxymuconolactone decarboxylase family protein [Pseudomonadota bacterium]